jgi:hypothetical protein
MRLSPSPDLRSGRALVLTALAVSLAAWAIIVLQHPDITTKLGDTDDAMRVTLVRDLLHGRGWYDQLERRLDPPTGVYMHWSRLLDGGLAGMNWLLARALPAPAAEWATRFFWPLLWIPLAVAGALVIARSLGTRSAVFVGAPVLLILLPLYRQFLPGRVDHHNIQITMAVWGVAGALAPWRTGADPRHAIRWAALAGGAAGLGLAIGLEALPFHAIAGASFAARLAIDRRNGAVVRAYGLALGGATAALFALQTPPARWSLSFCDAIGLNLVLALAVAGIGLALAGALADRIPAQLRIGLVAFAGLGAAVIYLAADPACVAGPFAGLDPRVRPFWFDRIQEIQPLTEIYRGERAAALGAWATIIMAGLGAALLVWRTWRPTNADAEARPDTLSLLTIVACLAVADVAGFEAWRMCDYVWWFGAPTLAAALSVASQRWLGDRMVPSVVMSICLSPLFVGALAATGANAIWPIANSTEPTRHCSDVTAYRQLASLPPGVVLSEIDLGPHIIANTSDSAIAAPYHRITGAILASHQALAAPPGLAESKVKALGADYIVDCPFSYLGVPEGSLGRDLREGKTPAWLQRLSGPTAPLQIYRVLR